MKDLSTAEINRQYVRLGTLLRSHSLSTSNGGKRTADADEFMLMKIDGTSSAFKHCDSRNYVHIESSSGKDVLRVPKTTFPWNGGTFDVFSSLSE